MILIRHRYIVFEEYYRGDKDNLTHLQCVTKSLTSTLIGIALKEGYIISTDQKMIDLLPEYVNKIQSIHIENVTIRHLLTMSSGVGITSYDPSNMKTLDFGTKYLFQPLGIKNVRWDDVYGYTIGSQSLQLTSRDMAKIGYLYLKHGRWDKKQILTTE